MAKYKCSKCGNFHDDWPAIAFDTPFHYNILSDEDKNHIAEINEDFCVIKHVEQTDRFVRGVMKQKVKDHCEDLEYGVWVSLSEKSFDEYYENFKNQTMEKTYFGFLCNQIPEYENTISIKTKVLTGSGNDRPEIFPHNDQMTNLFVKDYYEGITKDEAERRIKYVIEGK